MKRSSSQTTSAKTSIATLMDKKNLSIPIVVDLVVKNVPIWLGISMLNSLKKVSEWNKEILSLYPLYFEELPILRSALSRLTLEDGTRVVEVDEVERDWVRLTKLNELGDDYSSIGIDRVRDMFPSGKTKGWGIDEQKRIVLMFLCDCVKIYNDDQPDDHLFAAKKDRPQREKTEALFIFCTMDTAALPVVGMVPSYDPRWVFWSCDLDKICLDWTIRGIMDSWFLMSVESSPHMIPAFSMFCRGGHMSTSYFKVVPTELSREEQISLLPSWYRETQRIIRNGNTTFQENFERAYTNPSFFGMEARHKADETLWHPKLVGKAYFTYHVMTRENR